MLPLMPVLPQATVPLGTGRALKQAFGTSPRQLVLLEEVGVIASRVMERGEQFVASPLVELAAGAAMEIGGHEVLVRTPQRSVSLPPVPAGEPSSPAEEAEGFVHTGYAGKFGKSGLVDVLGRDDGLVNLEGRRACLDSIEDVMLQHRRLTWVRADLVHNADGDPQVHVEYRATGETAVDDIEEHAIGSLPPFMVPRAFTRLQDPA
jgi:acyl-CoA synthetase (AMP-forming)/AMP-acid ligase II